MSSALSSVAAAGPRLSAWVLACGLLGAAAVHAQSPAAVAEPAFVLTTVAGDTLIGLGRRYLVDPARWPEVARANALPNPNRIAVGTALRIPLRLMHIETVPATVLSVTGDVRSGALAVQVGQPVDEGSVLDTGTEGHVSVRLVDGTLLRLRPDSRLLLPESRRVRGTSAVQTRARIDKGRVEIEATPAPAGRPGFRIDTPQGVLGVRGTEFRVGVDTAQQRVRGEVLAGTVAFSGSVGAEQSVGAGQGAVIDSAGRVAAPVPLLAAPDLAALPVLQERLLMRFALPAQAGAAAYRGQIARDAGFDQVVADLMSPGPELRFAELPDGNYVLRARAIDAQGLEGRDADHRFRLKARPEPPLPSAPPPRAVIIGDRIDFSWAANAEAARYRLRLATDPGFKTIVRDIGNLSSMSGTLEGLAPGVYHWQLASVRADGDQGPWGDARSLELRPPPPPPPTPKPPQVSDSGVSFDWDGRPGQTFEFQVARDAAFAVLVLERKLDQPGIKLELPGTGRFHVRLRAIDPDGFVGPYSTAQHFDVPNCVRAGSGGCVRAGSSTLDIGP